MKVSTVVAAVSGSMFVVAGASAGFNGLEWVEVDNGGFADRTIDLYVGFDNPLDEVNAIAGTVLNQLSIRVEGGTYYQNAFGGNTAPNPLLFGVAPSLEFDTFLTIGKVNGTDDETQLSPGFAGFGPTEIGGNQDLNNDGQLDGENLVWFQTGAPQGVAGNSAGNRVLVARLSANALGPGGVPEFSGEMLVQGVEDGNFFSRVESFTTIPAPGALALLGLAGFAGGRRRRA